MLDWIFDTYVPRGSQLNLYLRACKSKGGRTVIWMDRRLEVTLVALLDKRTGETVWLDARTGNVHPKHWTGFWFDSPVTTQTRRGVARLHPSLPLYDHRAVKNSQFRVVVGRFEIEPGYKLRRLALDLKPGKEQRLEEMPRSFGQAVADFSGLAMRFKGEIFHSDPKRCKPICDRSNHTLSYDGPPCSLYHRNVQCIGEGYVFRVGEWSGDLQTAINDHKNAINRYFLNINRLIMHERIGPDPSGVVREFLGDEFWPSDG